MNWVKVMNTLPSHPKIVMVGDRAAWLFVCGLCYSNEHLTDGYVARAVLPVVCPGSKSPERLAVQLVQVGLWETADDGWQIHNYTDVQRTASEVKDIRRKDRERKSDSGRRDKSELGRNPKGSPRRFQAESNGTPDGTPDWTPDLARVAHSQEKRREEKRREPPQPPTGGRRRDVVMWEKAVDLWATEHFAGISDGVKRSFAVRQAVVSGRADSPEAVRAHIEQWFPKLAEELSALEAA